MAGNHIVLIGFMGSGKSSIGRLIAAKLGCHFVDTDQIVVREAGMEIPEIFRLHGEDSFRERERRAIESLKGGTTHRVIATGGGVVTRPENARLLRELGFVVWFTASEEVIFNRVSRNKKRPLLQTPNPRQTIASLLAQREPLYAAAAHWKIDTSAFSHDAVARETIAEARRFFSNPSRP